MAYTPATLNIVSWSSPLTIQPTDVISGLDDAVNAIVSTNGGSLKNYLNNELAKIPTYLSAELVKVNDETASQATAAANSATSAASSATSASSSATSATNSANSATTSATTATTQASNASSSATSASSSASSASTSATNASASATNAAASSTTASNIAATLNSANITMAIGNINSPLLDMPLKNSLAMKAGVGSATFTRASTATYIDRYGVLKTAAIDEPRFEKEGYLNEGASTNLLTYSEQFDNAIWNKSNTTIAANTAGTLDPYGTNIADKLIEAATTGTHYIYQARTGSNETVTISIFAKAAERSQIELRCSNFSSSSLGADFDLVTGTIGTIDPASSDYTSPYASITAVGNGWYRCSLTVTKGSVNTNNYFQIATRTTSDSYTGDGTSGFYIFGAQLEVLPFASSYIPTVASTVTRSADTLDISFNGNTPLGWNNKSIMIDFNSFGTGLPNGQGLYHFSDINYNMARIETGGVNLSGYYHGGAISIGTISPNILYRLGYIISGNSKTLNTVKWYLNGVLSNTIINAAPVGIFNTQTKIQIGYFTAAERLYGHLSNFRIFDKALTTQEAALA